MNRRMHLAGIVLAAVAIVAPLATGGAAYAAGPDGYRPPALQWSPCPEDATVLCASMAVPLDWNHPHGPTIQVGLAKRPATDPSARIGSLFVNPGGPGGSAREMVINEGEGLSPALRARFDLVGMDPRGVGASTPVMCSTDVLAQQPTDLPRGQADYDRQVAYFTRLRADCRAHTGPAADHLDMLSVVRDMDAARQAVGDKQLTYYGVSYGSLDGQQYAEMFPDRIRAIVADSNMDHSLGTWDFLATQAATDQDSFNEFVRWNNSTPSSVLYGQDVRAILADLRARAIRGDLTLPAPYPPGQKVSEEDLIGDVIGHLYGPAWAQLAEFLYALQHGTPLPGATAAQLGTTITAPRTTAPTDLVNYPGYSIFCQDWRLPLGGYQQYAQAVRRMAAIAPDIRYSPNAAPLTVACQPSVAPVPNPQHRLRVEHPATPLLLLNALHDPATGYNWAVNVAAQLGRSATLLTYEGWGHGAFFKGSACVNQATERYLLTRQLPAPGTHCPAVPPPTVTPNLAPAPQGPRLPYLSS